MEEKREIAGASIERGEITESADGWYVVRSSTRSGIETRKIRAINEYLWEDTWTHSEKYRYAEGDKVFFFIFGDGRGLILGKCEQ